MSVSGWAKSASKRAASKRVYEEREREREGGREEWRRRSRVRSVSVVLFLPCDLKSNFLYYSRQAAQKEKAGAEAQRGEERRGKE